MTLYDIPPDQIAEMVVERILSHLGRQAFQLAPAVTVRWEDRPTAEIAAESNLGWTVRDLVHYAKTGQGDPEEAWGALQTVCEALYIRPADYGAGYEVPILDRELDPSNPIDLVILATVARSRLLRDEPVSPRELAAVASVSESLIRKLTGAGEIPSTKIEGKYLRIPAGDARRWLASRDVPGFSPCKGREDEKNV